MNKKQMMKQYKEKLALIASRDFEKNQIVLIGDCLIENLKIDNDFPDLTIYNNGISGDTSLSLKQSLYKRAIKYKAKKVFLSIGSNDMGFYNMNVNDIYNNIIDIVQEIKRRSKDTEIHILTVVPVNPANMDSIAREYVDTRNNFDINMLNYYLKNYARKNHLQFVNITKHLKNGFDQLKIEYTIDGFHLNDLGYSVVSNTIKQFVY
ncbi:MAG: hypothetical protein KAH16_04070 [Candidatus Izimaplasma sp.]|nr:hypothetical protein [Candidatus Izimaplasma bacterium]